MSILKLSCAVPVSDDVIQNTGIAGIISVIECDNDCSIPHMAVAKYRNMSYDEELCCKPIARFLYDDGYFKVNYIEGTLKDIIRSKRWKRYIVETKKDHYLYCEDSIYCTMWFKKDEVPTYVVNTNKDGAEEIINKFKEFFNNILQEQVTAVYSTIEDENNAKMVEIRNIVAIDETDSARYTA